VATARAAASTGAAASKIAAAPVATGGASGASAAAGKAAGKCAAAAKDQGAGKGAAEAAAAKSKGGAAEGAGGADAKKVERAAKNAAKQVRNMFSTSVSSPLLSYGLQNVLSGVAMTSMSAICTNAYCGRSIVIGTGRRTEGSSVAVCVSTGTSSKRRSAEHRHA
jgi:hypothetical protein